MSAGTEDTVKKTRREAVWEVCDQLSAQGIKPSLRAVKMHYPRGSDTDVQKDVNGWFEHVFAQHARRRAIPSLPDSVVQAMEAFWAVACEDAAAAWAAERAEYDRNMSVARGDLDVAQGKVSQLVAAAELAARELSALRAQVSDYKEGSVRLEKELEHARQELHALTHRAEIREQDLLAELKRSREAHDRALIAQRDDFETQVRLVREAAAQQASDHQREMAKADAHYRDLESRSLLEIDATRQRLKGAEDTAERFRSAVHDRELENAGLKTELRLLRDAQREQFDDLVRRNEAFAAVVDDLQAKLLSVASSGKAAK